MLETKLPLKLLCVGGLTLAISGCAGRVVVSGSAKTAKVADKIGDVATAGRVAGKVGKTADTSVDIARGLSRAGSVPKTSSMIPNSTVSRVQKNQKFIDNLPEAPKPTIEPNALARLNELKARNGIYINPCLGNTSSNTFVATAGKVWNQSFGMEPAEAKKLCGDSLIKFKEFKSSYNGSFNSRQYPLDSETILQWGKENKIFQDLGSLGGSQNRRVFKAKLDIPETAIKEGNYYYVDRFHDGPKAHIEVFNSKGKHLGETSLDGRAWKGEADSKKVLTVD